jgi:hypothetical protein
MLRPNQPRVSRITSRSTRPTGPSQRELVIVSTISSRSEQGRPGEGAENPDRSPWVLLLIVPVVIPLITAIYNSVEPKLFGMPAFYWMQLAFVPLSALCTAVVYFKTRKR